MTTSRRGVLKGLAAAGVGASGLALLAGGRSLGRPSAFSTPLRVPALNEGVWRDGARVFDLGVQAGKTEFVSGQMTPTIGANGSFLGPVMRFKSGDRVAINVTNKLDVDTALHWHGLHVPAAADGGPHQVIKPGAMWSPSFEIKQHAGLFWYHSHMMERTGEQVNLGLAGPIIIDDATSSSLGLPNEYGVDDFPIVIQDRRFRADGSFDYLSTMPDAMMGFKGDVILVNGTVAPLLIVQRRRTRLRLLNGSNSRIYNIGLTDSRPLTQIGSDGSLLERPVVRQRIRLAPGERADVVVDLEPDSTLMLMNYPHHATGNGFGMMSGMSGEGDEFAILQLHAGPLPPAAAALPTRLIDVPSWEARKAERTRTFVLEMGMGGMMGGRMGGGGMGRGMGGGMTINGKSMDMERIDERIPLGSTEIWSIRNATPLSHPFHIHDIQFRILDRNGVPAEPHELGLKDTVLVDPGDIVRVITQFTDYADPHHPYMYHCHILEHEDAGMMGQFLVTA